MSLREVPREGRASSLDCSEGVCTTTKAEGYVVRPWYSTQRVHHWMERCDADSPEETTVIIMVRWHVISNARVTNPSRSPTSGDRQEFEANGPLLVPIYLMTDSLQSGFRCSTWSPSRSDEQSLLKAWGLTTTRGVQSKRGVPVKSSARHCKQCVCG